MVKTIQMVFVKSSGLGIKIEGDVLAQYQRLHTLAVDAYKRKMGMLEKISGKIVKLNFTQITNNDFIQEEIDAPLDRIIMVREDGTCLLLQGEAFTNYWEHHTQGLKFLGKKHNLTGQFVKLN